MTGAYLRVERDGKWTAIEVEHLRPNELRACFANRDTEEVMRWMDMLCSKLREAENVLDGLVKDGILEVKSSGKMGET